jgi:hypothetical protein
VARPRGVGIAGAGAWVIASQAKRRHTLVNGRLDVARAGATRRELLLRTRVPGICWREPWLAQFAADAIRFNSARDGVDEAARDGIQPIGERVQTSAPAQPRVPEAADVTLKLEKLRDHSIPRA